MKNISSSSLLAKAVLLAMLAQVFLPLPYALADCTTANAGVTIVCDTTSADTNGTASKVGTVNTITVNNSAVVNNSAAPALANTVNGKGSSDTVTNSGSVSNNTTNGAAIKIGDGSVTNNTSGTVNATNTKTIGVQATGNGSVINNGTITASGAQGDAVAVNNGNVTNSGTITASGGSGSNGITSNGNATVINNGTIDATSGDNGLNAKGSNTVVVTNNGDIKTPNGNGVNFAGAGTVTNNGKIDSGNVAVNGKCGCNDIVVVNNGTLSGNKAIDVEGGKDSVTLNSGSTTTGTGGTAIAMGAGNDTVVVKSGATVNGGIKTNGGKDNVTVEGGAKITGVIDGGGNFDTLTLVVDADTDLSGLNPASGSLSFAGQVYTWINFEQLVKMILERAENGGPVGPQTFFVNETLVGLMANNALSIEVIGRSGLIARLPFTVLKSLAKGESTRFGELNTDGWFVRVFNLGPSHIKPGWTYFQVNLYDASGNLISDQQGFILENK